MSDSVGAFGNPGNVIRVIRDVELQALNAAGLYVAQRYGCMITLGDEPPKFRGSGTLVQLSDQVVVATARHLFDGLPLNQRICVWWGRGNAKLCMPVSSVTCGPPDLDVAALSLGNPSDTEAVPLSQMGIASPVDLTNLMVISGISEHFTNADTRTKTLRTIWWTLGLCPLPDDHWPCVRLAPRPGIDLFTHYSNQYALDGVGKPMAAVPPIGLSGGGLWSVSLDGHGVWNPGAQTRLIGIQSSTGKEAWGWLRATRIEEWIRLLPKAGLQV